MPFLVHFFHYNQYHGFPQPFPVMNDKNKDGMAPSFYVRISEHHAHIIPKIQVGISERDAIRCRAIWLMP